jgi:hypothetical protein
MAAVGELNREVRRYRAEGGYRRFSPKVNDPLPGLDRGAGA